MLEETIFTVPLAAFPFASTTLAVIAEVVATDVPASAVADCAAPAPMPGVTDPALRT